MRMSRAALPASAAALLALALTGCNSNSSSSSTAANTQAPQTKQSSQTTTGGSTGGSSTGGGGKAAECTKSNLSAKLTNDRNDAANGDRKVDVVLTNTGSAACLVQGFPGVSLQGPPVSGFPAVYDLPRQPVTATQVTLAPGAHATATLSYLNHDPSDTSTQPWTPTSVLVTPPDSTEQFTVAWTSGQSVLRQDMATHPGTYIGPLNAS